MFKRLYDIFTATLHPGMPERVFKGFYQAPELIYIDVSFVVEDEKDIGFCAAAFYKIKVGKKEHIVGRAAVGIDQDCQGNALPVKTLFYKFIHYKLQHPFASLILTGYIANPLIYDMICKYTGWVYPRMGQKLPEKLRIFKESIVHKKQEAGPGKHPMAVKLHFSVRLGVGVMKRVLSSSSKFVKEYLHMNPDCDGKLGLVVLVPVTWSNITVSMTRLAWRGCRKWFIHWRTNNHGTTSK